MSSSRSDSTFSQQLELLIAALDRLDTAFAIVPRGTDRRSDADWAAKVLLTRRSAKGGWVIARDLSGAPNVPGWGISISYARDWLAVAVSAHRAVGIDIEADRLIPCSDWPTHLMTRAEIALLRREPALFLTVWTLKEALSKEAGTGLMVDGAMFDTAPFAAAPPFALSQRRHGGLACHWRLRLKDQLHHLAISLGPG